MFGTLTVSGARQFGAHQPDRAHAGARLADGARAVGERLGLRDFSVCVGFDGGVGGETFQNTYDRRERRVPLRRQPPRGPPLRVFPQAPVFETEVQVTATIPSAGATVIAPPIVFEGASVRVRVEDDAGNVITGNYLLVLAGRYAGAFDGSDFVLAAVPAGTYDLELRVNNDPPSLVASQPVEVGDTSEEVLVVFTVSGVTGVVRHASGEVVPGANVALYSESGSSYYTSTDAQGAYGLAGVAPSPFTLRVNDGESGLGAEVTSVMPEGRIS